MHPADINAALRKKGLNQTAIAKSLTPPVDPSLVTKVVQGDRANEAVRTRISQAVGIPVSRLWPGRRKVA